MKWIASLAGLLVFLIATKTAADEIPEVVQQALPRVDIRHVDRIEISSPLFIVTTSQGVLYVDAKGRYLFTGDLYDLVEQQNLSQQYLAGRQRVRFEDLPLLDAILYKRGKHRIAIFADPDCPVCQRMHPELKQLDAEVYIFLFPLTELHPLAYRKSVSIWCHPDRAAALDAAMSRQSVTAQQCNHPVDQVLRTANRLGLRATPTIILGDGRVMEGFRTASELKQMLERSQP